MRQYDQMIRDGVIGEEAKVELIEGVLVTKTGRNRPHVQAGNKGLRALQRILPPAWHARKEDPVVASDWSKPEPDLAVIRGEIEDYDRRDVLAADVALVVEIADSSLSADQVDMNGCTAPAMSPCTIVNLVDRQVEVYTDPSPEGSRSSQVFRPGQDVPVVIGGAEVGRVAVSDLLP